MRNQQEMDTETLSMDENAKQNYDSFEDIDSLKEQNDVTKQKVREKENDITIDNKSNGDAKKKRNARKRNRCDMSPEELRRLRERERKAQQTRRDRIRAQKRQNQALSNDEAVWDAFVDQKTKNKIPPTHTPTMVCQDEDTKNNIEPLERKYEAVNNNMNNNVKSETRYNSSDDSNQSESVRDIVSPEGRQKDQFKRTYDDHIEYKGNTTEFEKVNRSPISPHSQHYDRETRYRHLHFPEYGSNGEPSHSFLHSPPIPTPSRYHRHYHHKLSPHEYYPPYPYITEHHIPRHPFSPSSIHTRHPHHKDHGRNQHEKKHHEFVYNHYPVRPYQKKEQKEDDHTQESCSQRNNKDSLSTGERKERKNVNRIVDRKHLPERELEKLRKRERDYQRERRARIRMEKAKTQAQQEFHYKSSEKFSNRDFYHPLYVYERRPTEEEVKLEKEDIHRSSLLLKINESDEHTKELEVEIPSLENSDQLNSVDKINNKESDLLQVVPKTREYEEKVPASSPLRCSPNATSSPTNAETKPSKKSIIETICSSLKKESNEWIENEDDDDRLIVDTNEEEESEKAINISMLKPDNPYINGEEVLFKLKEELMSDVDCSGKQEKSHDESKSLREKITDEQLERRRRSNREAQRRRRARLKLQGNPADERSNGHAHHELTYEWKGGAENRKHYYATEDRHNVHDQYDKMSSHTEVVYHHEMYPYYPYYPKDKHRTFHRPEHYRQYHQQLPLKHHPKVHSPHHISAPSEEMPPSFHYYRHHSPPSYHYRQRSEENHRFEKHLEKEQTKKSPIPSPTPTSGSKDDSFNDSNGDFSALNSSSKSNGRKRKQFAPRKVMASTNTTPEDEEIIDVMNRSHDIPEEEDRRVLILATENYDGEDVEHDLVKENKKKNSSLETEDGEHLFHNHSNDLDVVL